MAKSKSKNKTTEFEEKSEPETLYDLEVGQTAWVTSIEITDANMRRRLQDFGIIQGTRVVCRQRAPSGNPKSYLVRGAVIAIREADSSKVLVTTTEPSRDYLDV
ncbi:MAG: ferrous iron transport protein A [Clostridia bacterium]|nr:ferrous iron transport protein A [Clostridia bacterium]